MAGFSATTANAILDCYFNQTNITAPTAIYLGLYASGNELSGNNYSRVDVTSAFGASASGAVTNTSAIDLPTASGAWSAATEWGLFTASSGGTAIYRNTCSLAGLAANEFHRIPIGDLDVSLDV